MREALGHGVADVIVMLGFTLNHHAQANHGVHFLVLGQQLGPQRQFEATRHTVAEDVFGLGPVFEQRVVGPGTQHVGDFVVPFGHHQPKALFADVDEGGSVVGTQVLQGSCHKLLVLLINRDYTGFAVTNRFIGRRHILRY